MEIRMGIILNEQELTEITGKKRNSAQVRVLRALRIPVKVRPDGFPLVSRATYDQIMGSSISDTENVYKPNLEAIS